MKSNTIKYLSTSFAWGIVAKIIDACIKFISIPLLLNYLGKEEYGLITLAIAANAYMQLLNMGMNTGSVKFFSQWIHNKNMSKVDRVARTSLTVYLFIGFINMFLLIMLAIYGRYIFSVNGIQFETLRNLLLILACFSSINWVSFIFNQLLIADEKIGYTQQVLSIRTIMTFLAVLLTINMKLSIFQYFALHLSSSVLVLFLYYLKCKSTGLIVSFFPAFYWTEFLEIFKYSLAIFAMSLFQFSATQSRPLILGMFSTTGISILSEYRVIEVFPIFIISIGGMLLSILLPKTSKAIQANDKNMIEKIAYEGTKYSSIIVSFLCFPVMLVAKELITLYVGDEYLQLTKWLILWVGTLSLFLHNTPVSSLVLSTGKTKMLVYSSAIACIVSIIVNAVLCPKLGVGSAVIGYLVYIIIQMFFYYFYFNRKILKLNSPSIFLNFVIPTSLGFVSTFLVYLVDINLSNLYLQGTIKAGIYFVIFMSLLSIFRVLNTKKIVTLLFKIKGK